MATSMGDDSLGHFRHEAQTIRDRAEWQIFGLLSAASVSITLLFALAILARTPGSIFLWPILGGLLLTVGAVWWTCHTRRIEAGIALLSTMMIAGISGVIIVQRGSNAPALVYGLATIAVLSIAGHGRIAGRLALWLAAWSGAVTWASHTGKLSIDAVNPFGLDYARLLALVVALILIALAARIVQRRRSGIDAMLEQALRMTEVERDEARSLAERRARTVAEIGHEIRTPMTGIVGTVQLLSQKALSPSQRQLLSIHRQSAERLLQLVNAVLAQAKLESAPEAIVDAPYSPRALAAEVTELFAPQAHRKGVEIIWLAESAVPQQLNGDAMRVRQILSNLVSNAVKFTDTGSVEVHLRRPSPTSLRFEVRDTGRGVLADKLDAIFERFVSDATGDEATWSTGLGLPISRDLARRMGGDISVSSAQGTGSCFSLSLACTAVQPGAAVQGGEGAPMSGHLWVVGASAPLERQLSQLLTEMGLSVRFLDRMPSEEERAGRGTIAQAILVDAWVGHGRCLDLLPDILADTRVKRRRLIVANSVAQDAAFGSIDDIWQLFRPLSRRSLGEALEWAFESSAPATVAPAGEASAMRPRILLVDDNAVNQIIGKAMLEQLGASVTVAHGGRSALEEHLRQPFEMILMDLQMPEMDGLAATRRLRMIEQDSGLRRTPVVAITGQAAVDIETACAESGFDAVMYKPYTIEQLRSVVERHVEPRLNVAPVS